MRDLPEWAVEGLSRGCWRRERKPTSSERVAGAGKGARRPRGKSSPAARPCLLWENGRTERLPAPLLPRRSFAGAGAVGLRRRFGSTDKTQNKKPRFPHPFPPFVFFSFCPFPSLIESECRSPGIFSNFFYPKDQHKPSPSRASGCFKNNNNYKRVRVKELVFTLNKTLPKGSLKSLP